MRQNYADMSLDADKVYLTYTYTAKLLLQMHECHQAYDRGSDLPNNEVCVEEALQYFFLMTHAKHYDADNEFIAPAFEYLDAEVYEVQCV
jgi:hypothetical protein